MNQQHKGLNDHQIHQKLKEYGPNVLARAHKISPIKIFLSQFKSPLIIILIVAAIISFSVGFLPDQESKLVDTILILVIVLLSGIMGFVQDYNAEKTIEALQNLASPNSRVIRNGKEEEIDSSEIVPEDILVIESGDMITADVEILEAFQLEVDESVLTGESNSVKKKEGDLAFMNTYVLGGKATALVKATGMKTQIGKVADKLESLKREKSSFQIELNSLSKKLSITALIITVIITLIGIQKFGLYDSLLTAISLAVAAIPEGLPAVVVLALAVGSKIMAKRNALIRKLTKVESIGAVNIICTDKTGTLTKNEMTITHLYFNNTVHEVSKNSFKPQESEEGKMLMKCAYTCNNASVSKDEFGQQKYFGSQTEIALKKYSAKHLDENFENSFSKTQEISFSSKRKMMSVVVEDESQKSFAFSKGAPEVLIEKCSFIMLNGKIEKLTESIKQEINQQNKDFAKKALRVLGFAFKENITHSSDAEKDMVWLGLQAMIDPPRPEVYDAISDCKTAGIRVIMITGDNPITAAAIAKEVGLDSNHVLEGTDIDEMSDEQLNKALNDQTNIFARTTPFHKLRLLELLEEKNTVAMTGDGVNDALAIKKAAIGIAMGKKGTEVAKQASDIILLDDNFSTITNAIKQGRTIFYNIRKFINYLLTCNLAEVGIIFTATVFFSLDEPLLYPVQLLWINLLTDGLVALALGVDPSAEDVMKEAPRKLNEPIIDKKTAWLIVSIGIKMAALLIIVFIFVLPMGIERARTTLITGVVVFEFVRIGAIRYQEKIGWFANKWLVMGLIISLVLHVALIYSPLNSFFYLIPIGLKEWGIILSGAIIGYLFAISITSIIMKTVKT
ncbi:cation-translocating P-type ATPase [Marivirga arenosa]|uniref:P-type Cu(+) transporter n=1 Tax=Marivirga arenosa TaxID=3059076 RepID=A0AA49GKF5_9BACT|nr:cation-translocating P-type ATPase [Marivirga sp. ABR2-2]WKK84394.2 cation-translocating P-type ATPase [Marivirga sp. ABR2-2]